MKWYFAISESSLGLAAFDWPRLIKVAVTSARQHTDLQPHLLYDGNPNALTEWLQRQHVTIIPCHVPYLDGFERYSSEKGLGPAWLSMAAGALLRLEIPEIEREDEVVLYTDCDVIFTRGFSLDDVRKPRFFAAAPERRRSLFRNMNSGVMVINVPAMRQDYPSFVAFIRQNVHLGFDQEMLAAYYRRRFEVLPNVLNWRPYWGVNESARLIHFHGPKPAALGTLMENEDAFPIVPWRKLYQRNRPAYRRYLAEWERYAEAAEVL